MLPSVLRKPIIKAFVKVLATPLLVYYDLSAAFYTAKLAEIQPNLLTDVLQALLRTIYPNTAGTNFKCWVYNQHELTPQVYLQFIGGHMLQEYDYFIGETFTQEFDYFIDEQRPTYDYVVVVPIVYNTAVNVAKLQALLTKYKPAGKSFSISFQNIV
jgi:hypothetical protein